MDETTRLPREALMTVEQREWLKQMVGILEILNEGVAIIDDSEHVLFVNKCMERLFGTSRSELIGRAAVNTFYSGEDYEYTQERRALVKGVGYDRFEFFVPRADGTRVPVILSSREMEAPDGSHFSVITCTDITEQKKAEQKLRDANVQLERRAEEIERDLTLASRVQQSLAPQALKWGRLAVETYYMPVRTIGGDFGLVAPLDGTHLDLIICDVSGHGISSALLANRVYTETVTLLRYGMELGEMLRTLNRFVIAHIGASGYMFTMAAARLDQTGRQLIYAAAGHPPSLLISSSGEVHLLEPLSTVLGALKDAVPLEASKEFKLSAGDRLMLYSDGLIEVWNRENEMLGVEGLEKIVRSAAALPLPTMRQAIIQGVASYSAEPLQDDVSLVLVEVR
jgi:sigma-B regulation protein RsbU (phosphoserine phosphatase)